MRRVRGLRQIRRQCQRTSDREKTKIKKDDQSDRTTMVYICELCDLYYSK